MKLMFRKDIPKKDKFAVIYFPHKILVSCPFCECAFLKAAPTDKDYTHFFEHSIILEGEIFSPWFRGGKAICSFQRAWQEQKFTFSFRDS